MQLSNLKPSPRKLKKRVGKGNGSGNGKTCGKGHKGQKSRSGGNVHPWFEGGQMPLYRRLPRRGFNNANFKKSYQLVNVGRLAELKVEEVDPQVMFAAGLINSINEPVKVLSDGEISSAMKIKANKFSKKAMEKITEKGGEAIVL